MSLCFELRSDQPGSASQAQPSAPVLLCVVLEHDGQMMQVLVRVVLKYNGRSVQVQAFRRVNSVPGSDNTILLVGKGPHEVLIDDI